MENGDWDLKKRCYYTYACGWMWATQWKSFGTNILDRDWDILIILDSCRTDLISEVSNEYEFIGDIDSIWSVGSITTEWMAQTFRKDKYPEIADTGYLSTTPHTETVFDKESYLTSEIPLSPLFPSTSVADRGDFDLFEEVWQYGYDSELGVVPPRTVTDRAIQIKRQENIDRLVIHYMQPHEPFIGEDNINNTGKPLWEGLKAGDLDPRDVWQAYKENLHLVLEDISLLLDNIDADKVVISADHGNLFGEWGQFGHPIGFLHPAVRRVPWIETTAKDLETYKPASKPEQETHEVEEMLKNLGYIK
jgi:hypothetical protein